MIVGCGLGGLLSLRWPFTTLDTEIPRVCNGEYIRSHLSKPSSSKNALYARKARVGRYAPFVLCGCISNALARTHSESGFSPDEFRIGGKNNCRARSRREITTQRIPILGSPRFAFPGSPAGARLQSIPLGPSHNLGLRLLTVVHPSRHEQVAIGYENV